MSIKQMLPHLCENIKFLPSATTQEGISLFLVHDQARQRFFQIGEREYQILTHWNFSLEHIVASVNAFTEFKITPKIVLELLVFLKKNELIKGQGQNRKHTFLSYIKKMFCLQIPLFKPDAFLKATLPFIRPFFTKKTGYILAFLFCIALALLVRQGDIVFSPEHFFWYFFALVIAKIAHELGHAYALCFFGCSVPTMGIAVMLGIPLLYTDATDSWRLENRTHRILISLAGIISEVVLAVFAVLVASFLSAGAVKSACFFLATASLLTTFLINLNPLMRFDGYYVLCDILKIDNLKPRALALVKVKIRHIFAGVCVENTQNHTKFMFLYGFFSWIYTTLFILGISVSLIYSRFQMVGMVLGGIILFVFLILPLINEFLFLFNNISKDRA